MNISQRAKDAEARELKAIASTHLQTAIDDIEYGIVLDKHARLMLRRWIKDGHEAASTVFAKLNVNYFECRRIIETCIDAERVRRQTFAEKVKLKKDFTKQLSKRSKAIALLKEFLKEIEAGPADPLDAYILYDAEDLFTVKHGLYILEDAIAARKRIDAETTSRLGITRKSGIKEAATNAALGWLAEGVNRITCRPHYEAVADLASFVFDCEIFPDRVKEAVRARRSHP